MSSWCVVRNLLGLPEATRRTGELLDSHRTPKPATVWAVVSLFHPDRQVLETLVQLSRQFVGIVAVDDSGTTTPLPFTAADISDNAMVLRNETNMGLATSLNRGCKAAFAAGADAVVTLDQDGTLPAGYVSQLVAGFADESRGSAGLAPRSVNGYAHPTHRHGADLCSFAVVQHGLLLLRAGFEHVGGFREALFIDGIEAAFVADLHVANLHIVLKPDLNLHHPIGRPKITRIAGYEFTIPGHSPERLYYQFRNSTHLVLRVRGFTPSWRAGTALRLIKLAIKVGVFAGGRRASIGAASRGVVHGLRGRLGQAPPSTSWTWEP